MALNQERIGEVNDSLELPVSLPGQKRVYVTSLETAMCILGILIQMDEFHPMKLRIQNSRCNKIVINKSLLTHEVVTE